MLPIRRSACLTSLAWLAVVPALLLLGSSAPAQSTVTNGLVAYWSFDDNFLDSIKAFHGTPRGTAPISFVGGKTGFGKAIQLNGVDQFVEITGGNENELEFPGGSMSIAGWFKVDAFDTDWQALISKGEGENWRVARSAATSSLAYAGGVGEGPNDAPDVLTDGLWHHFVAVSDATGTNNPHGFGTAIYIDGAVYGIQMTLPVLASSSFNVMIGENPASRGREWEGLIDDIGIWNRVLTENEITNLYAAGVGKAISTLLPPPQELLFVSNTRQTSRSFTFGITDFETNSILDPAMVNLRIDGQVKTTTFTKTGLETTFNHTNFPAWAPGSTHTFTIEARDTQGRPLTQQGSFTLPQRWFPVADLPGPAITSNAWAIRWIIQGASGNQIGNIPNVINSNILAIGTAAFTGAFVDTTNSVINYVSGGLFGNNLPIPDEVLTHPSGLWSGDDYILFAVGHIEIPEEGDYTFGVHSDDGFAFRIRGGEAISISGNGELDPVDPEATVHPNNTGDSNTRTVYHLKKGVYRVEWFFWERGGGDNGEFYSAKGAFRNDADTSDWALVGDTNAVAQTFDKPGVADPGWRAYGTVPDTNATAYSLGEAVAALEATTGATTNTYPALFMTDPQDSGGGAGAPAFPSDTPAADNYFAVRATGAIVVTDPGDYEIGFDSDDGAWMKMPGKTFTEIIRNATGVATLVGTDEVQVDLGTGSSLTTVKVNLTAGTHPIEIGWYEMTGGGFLRGIGAKFGVPASVRLPTLVLGPPGTFTSSASIKLTGSPTGVVESIKATITKSGSNVVISWTPAGGTLQRTSSLSGTPTWTDVGTANPATIAVGAANEFFRVRQ